MPGGLAVVTGATGGLGYETALGLAKAGMEVILTGRDAGRGAAALRRLKAAAPRAAARFALLDLSSLAGVEAFASGMDRDLAVLVNNAGVMALPRRQTTADGFERQFGVNYLGHFALTGRLLARLRGGRVVNVSSLAHRGGAIGFDDLQAARRYNPRTAYRQSKLAMLMFSIELQRRSEAEGWGVQGIAAHPGWAASELVTKGPGHGLPRPIAKAMQRAFNALGQPTADGAKPILYAALDKRAAPGKYYGPCRWGETRGEVVESRAYPQARREKDLARLWEASESLTQVRFARPRKPDADPEA